MRVSLCKQGSSVPILTSVEDVVSLVEEEKRDILTEWLASLNKGSGKPPLIYYCRQGTFNRVEYSGMHFSAYDFQKDGKNCYTLVAQGVYLFNTMFLPSSTPSSLILVSRAVIWSIFFNEWTCYTASYVSTLHHPSGPY